MQSKRTSTPDTEPSSWIYDRMLAVKILVSGLLFSAVLITTGVFMTNKPEGSTQSSHSLTIVEKRKENPTRLTRHKPAPQDYENTAPTGVQVISYQSAGRKLLAWLVLPNRKPPYPAVMFAHGGMALGSDDVEQVKPFINSGYAVLLPTWRGENGNKGDFEMCFGEVDDALAAIDFLAVRKDIDKGNIYAAGHSIGATIVMLVAEMTPKLKKAAACGGLPDMNAAGKAYENPPFDDHNINERLLRSPASFLGDLKCPMLLLYGANDRGDNYFFDQAQKMKEDGQKLNKKVTIEQIPNTDHFTSMAQAIPKMISFFETGDR